jgi:peptide chain release factor subunit 1
MITRENLSELSSFNPEGYLTTSLYLHIEGTPQPTYVIELKDLIKDRKNELEKQQLPPDKLKSVQSDLKKVQEFVTSKFSRNGVRTLILFSCSGKKWWKELTINSPIRSRLVINSKPYILPLTVLLDEHKRFLCILVDSSKARLFEVFAGEILEHNDILDEVPGKVKAAGFGGYEERRIERHIEDHVRRHFKHVADHATDFFRRYQNDFVILGGSEQNTNEFRNYLHSTLQDKVVSTFQEELNTTPKAILERAMLVEDEIRLREQKELLERFFAQVNSGGLGIVGLDSTLKALRQGQVNYLLVKDGYGIKGFRCRECFGLHAENGPCTYCNGPTEQIPDVVDEAVQDAIQQGCRVKYITLPESEFSLAGNIGAILRFRA